MKNFVQIGKKVVCVGRNYANHAKELGNAVPTTPMLFLKPTSAYVTQGGSVVRPVGCKDLHYEVELGVVIKSTLKKTAKEDVKAGIAGYCLGIDMTARDLQEAAKKQSKPWSVAKGYDTFLPVSDFIPESDIPDPQNVELFLEVDGVTQQRGSTEDMIFDITTLISHISHIFTLQPGDVVLTGTPEGVGEVKPGQVLRAGIEGVVDMSFPVVAEQ